MLDPISEMLTRIRNAQRAGHKDVVVPFSKLKMSIAKILEDNNFVELVTKEKEGNFDQIKIVLKYDVISNTKKVPAITEIKRMSKQGQRMYIKKSEISRVKNGYGIAVISTSKGLMTGDDARRKGLGGEYICRIW